MNKTDKELKEIATTLLKIIAKQGCEPPDAMKVIDILFNVLFKDKQE